MALRHNIPDFAQANSIYIGATVTFWTIDGSGVKTSTKATLYDAVTGSGTLANPVTLDSEGKFSQPVYIETAVIATISGLTIADHDTGIIAVIGKWRSDWATATIYYAGEFVRAGAAADGTNDILQVQSTHTSATFATDLSGGKLALVMDVSTFSAIDATLTAIAALATAADKGIYFTGSDLAALFDLTAAGRALLDDANAAAQLTTLGIPTPFTVANGGTGVATLTGIAKGSGTSAFTAATDGTDYLSNTTGRKQGTETIWVPAVAMYKNTTNGSASGTAESTTNDIMTQSFDFDQTTQEFAMFAVRFPKSWDEGTVTFAPIWTAASGTGGVVFGLAGVALSDDDAIDTAVGTAQTSTDTLIATTDIHVGPTSSAITIAGTPAAGDWVAFKVNRTVADGSDTLNADARLLGLALFFTTNSSDDT